MLTQAAVCAGRRQTQPCVSAASRWSNHLAFVGRQCVRVHTTFS